MLFCLESVFDVATSVIHIHIPHALQMSRSAFLGSAVIAKLLRMQMLSDDDELASEATGDKWVYCLSLVY